MNFPNPQLSENERLDGFVVRRVTPLANVRSVAYEFLHESTGAKILHLHNEDAENLFSVTFPTPPPDDTGVPHILEHSVLAGSRKYQVKDPFFEMVKCSMATFINAMTGSDYTVYPVASNVRQDFYNLAEVYWDAVFHPLLTEKTFEREGHHLELERRDDPASNLIIKGIVYNEMKGARSSPESKVHDLMEKNLWPDTPYGKDSGGDPDRIPDLTWQGLRDFHRSFYQPANAFIFLYGDIPTRDHLRFLSPRLAETPRHDVQANLPSQPRWATPRTMNEVYPVAPTDETTGKTFVVLNWLAGLAADVDEAFAFAALERILLGNQAAPLRKALIDSKLGEDLTHSGYWANGVDTSFHVGLKGTEADRAAKIESLVLNTLKRVADEGVSHERFDAAMQQLSYRYLEITSSYPLNLMSSVVSMWQHGSDPLTLLRADEHISKLKRLFSEDPNFLGKLINERLLNNTHRLTLIVRPDGQIQDRKDAEFACKMQSLKQSMSPQQLRAIAENQAELEAQLSAPNSPEAIASLPQLRVSDLPRKPRHIPTTAETLPSGGTMLTNDVFANGVNYLQISFDLTGLPAELYPYLPLYSDAVHKMGAGRHDYTAIAQRVAAYTGGVGFSSEISGHIDDPGRLLRQATFSTKFLDENADQALSLLRDLMFELEPGDVPRLTDVLLQGRAHQRMRPTHDGMGLALRHAARRFSLGSFLRETIDGLPLIHLFEKIAAVDPQPLIGRLKAIRQFMLNPRRLTLSFTGSGKIRDLTRSRIIEWTAGMAEQNARDTRFDFFPATGGRDGLAAPMNVAYCTLAMPAPHLSHADAAALTVGSRLLSLNYVLEEVRFKGTAYGGGCSYNPLSQLWSFHSYRDPWVNRTLDVYTASLDHIRAADWSQGDVDRMIIGTAKEGERPIRPGAATGMALWRHLTGDTPEKRDGRHAAVLAATLSNVRRALIGQFESSAPKSAICVVSSRQKLEEANRQRTENPLEIQDILQ